MQVEGHPGKHCHLTDLRTSLFVSSSCVHPASTPYPSTLSTWHTPVLQALLALQPHPQTKWLYLVSLGRQNLSRVLRRGRNWGDEAWSKGEGTNVGTQQSRKEHTLTHTHSFTLTPDTHAYTHRKAHTTRDGGELTFDKLIQNFPIRKSRKRRFYFQH